MLSVLIVKELDWKNSCVKFALMLKIEGNLSTKRGASNRGKHELHFMLGITDVLIGTLVEDVMQWDGGSRVLLIKKKY